MTAIWGRLQLLSREQLEVASALLLGGQIMTVPASGASASWKSRFENAEKPDAELAWLS